MTDDAKKARRDYHNEWNRRNPDKVKAATERYWIKKAATLAANDAAPAPQNKQQQEGR